MSEFLSTQKDLGLNIIESYEENLLGTAGTLIKNEKFFKGYSGLLIHSDNYTDFNLKELLNH